MKTFAWYADESFLHRLNPLTKLAACLLTAAVVSTAGEPTTPALVVALGLASTRWLGHVPWSMLVRTLTFGLLASFGVFWTYTIFYGGSGVAWMYGLTMAVRLLAVLSVSAMFVLTTDPSQFVRALIHQGHVSPRIAYSVFAAYRFIPLLQVEFDTIRAAHQMRGGVRRGGPGGRIREMLGYAIPLLVSAVRTGERVALAMESRGFGALPAQQRTYFRVTIVRWADVWFSLACLVVSGALLALRTAH